MFDKVILKSTKSLVDTAAKRIVNAGFNAEHVTFAAFGCGVFAAVLIAAGHSGAALMPLLLSRLLDGLDGAVARVTHPTDRGAFLDIVLDFIFYASVPLAFATVDPVAAALLLAAFVGTGSSFLAYAIIAAKRGQSSETKSFYYLGGLTEGAETILFFSLMCLWPGYFSYLAYVFAGLCVVTISTRIWAGWTGFVN